MLVCGGKIKKEKWDHKKAAAVCLSVLFVMTDAECFSLTTTLLHWKVWQTNDDDDGQPIFILFLGSTFSHVGHAFQTDSLSFLLSLRSLRHTLWGTVLGYSGPPPAPKKTVNCQTPSTHYQSPLAWKYLQINNKCYFYMPNYVSYPNVVIIKIFWNGY